MKLSKGCSEAFAAAARVAALSSSRPEFSSVRIDVAGGSASLVACSDGVWFRTSIPVTDAPEDVSFSVPAHLAAEAFRDVSSDGAELLVEDDRVKVSSGRARYRMRRTSVTDALVFPESQKDLEFSRERSVLFDDLLAVSSAAARDASLPVMSAVRMEVSPADISVVATDSFRLATASRPASLDGALLDRGFLLPVRELPLLSKLFGRTGLITITVPRSGESWMQFSDGSSTLRISSLAGNFPQWRRLLENAPPHAVSFEAGEFAGLLARLSPYGQTVSLEVSAGSLTLEASGDDGEMSASMDAETPEGMPERISASFQRTFLADAVRSMPDGRIEMLIGSERSPLWFRTDGRTHLVMPRTSA